MKKLLIFFIGALVTIFTSAQNDYSQQWEALHKTKKQALEQFNDAKFGLFVHWGLYAKPAGVWNGKNIQGIGEWIMFNAKIDRADYKLLAKDFNPIKFDADSILKLASDAGMKYVICMPKHHDGFSMYHSKVSKYNIYDATPFKRDPINEFYKASKKWGLHFGFYYSQSVDWMDGGDANVDAFLNDVCHGKIPFSKYIQRKKHYAFPSNYWDPAPCTFQEYIDKKAIPQLKELLTSYPDVMEIWFDMNGYCTPEQSRNFYKTVYDLQPKVVISSRIGNNMGDFITTGDNRIPSKQKESIYWETPGTLNDTWGYKENDTNWKSAEEVIFWLTDIMSKGGNYLLNIGPKADGSIPQESIDVLRKVGQWTSINGESIYGTHCWKIFKEGERNVAINGTGQRAGLKNVNFTFSDKDFWFTQKGKCVYATSLCKKYGSSIFIKSLSKKNLQIDKVSILGVDNKIRWSQKKDGLKIYLPKKSTKKLPYGIVVKIVEK